VDSNSKVVLFVRILRFLSFVSHKVV